jgi:hypothetical protein
MSDERRVNLADPDYEPTDDDLTRLAREAFADVVPRHLAALQRLREAITLERARLLLERASRAVG